MTMEAKSRLNEARNDSRLKKFQLLTSGIFLVVFGWMHINLFLKFSIKGFGLGITLYMVFLILSTIVVEMISGGYIFLTMLIYQGVWMYKNRSIASNLPPDFLEHKEHDNQGQKRIDVKMSSKIFQLKVALGIVILSIIHMVFFPMKHVTNIVYLIICITVGLFLVVITYLIHRDTMDNLLDTAICNVDFENTGNNR